jgi:hypothetical protein
MLSFARVLTVVCVAVVLTLPMTGRAESQQPDSTKRATGSEKSVDEIAREMSNPLAAFWRFDYTGEHRTYQGSIPGAEDQSGWIHNFQFTLPFREKDGKGWVFRFGLPYVADKPVYWANNITYTEWRIRLEDPTGQEGAYWEPVHSHTDDTSFDLVYGGVNDSGRILNYGLAGILPTSSDTSNAKQQLILGPAVNIGQMADWGVYGVLFSHIIDVVEKRDKGTPDTMQTTLQAYFSYDLGRGWQIISNPTVTYDWKADGGNKLNLPLGGGIAKTIKIGTMPLRFTAEAQYFVASTDRLGPDWLYKFSVSPIMPSKHTRH